MDGFTIYEVDPALEIVVAGTLPQLTGALDREVQRQWKNAKVGRPGVLFNGLVFSADRITPRLVSGHFTEFRRIVAQMLRPELYLELRLHPLAVNGILRLTDGILIGRRSARTAYQQGMWQLPPAGSVDPGALDANGRIDLTRQLLKELAEEIGVIASPPAVGRPLCLVEHPGSRVLDIGIPFTIPLDSAAVLARHARAGNAEYDSLRVIAESELAGVLAELGRTVVPPARTFLTRLGLIAESGRTTGAAPTQLLE